MNSNERRVVFLCTVCKVIARCSEEGLEFMPFRFYGTKKEQERYFKDGKSLTRNSKHERWLAIDFALIKNGEVSWEDGPEYKRLGEIAEEEGLAWGGRIKKLNDIYHIEYKE